MQNISIQFLLGLYSNKHIFECTKKGKNVTIGPKFLRRLKEGHKQFLDLKKIETIESKGATTCELLKISNYNIQSSIFLNREMKTVGNSFLHLRAFQIEY